MELIHGDCLEEMKHIPENSVDMVLVDLPYGVTNNSWDTVIPYEPMWEQVNRVVRNNTPCLFFGRGVFGSDLIQSNKKNFRYEWVWDKGLPGGFLLANKMPLRVHENIYVFYKKLPKYHPQKWIASTRTKTGTSGKISFNYDIKKKAPYQRGDYTRYPIDIIKFSNAVNKDKVHPTQKPVDLLEYLIKTYTDEGDVVLDFCMGSGSTGVACINTGRDFIGIEKDDNYFDIATKRIENALKGYANVTKIN